MRTGPVSDAAEFIEAEPVLVEFEWYDGPRAGIAEVEGIPSYFRTDDFASPPDEASYLTWPVPPDVLPLEIESWMVFVAWNGRYEAGNATVESHPGQGGVDARFDALESVLSTSRTPPSSAELRRADWLPVDLAGSRYQRGGPSYRVRWTRSVSTEES